MLGAKNICYEVSGKINATSHGGIGAIHKMNQVLQLPQLINSKLKLFKIHNPYFESDHILNLAYNVVCGGNAIEDLETLRSDDAYMNALGATRIPDPTTAGDFLRRFGDNRSIEILQEISIKTTQRVWGVANSKKKYPLGIIDIDGSIVSTTGEYKEGMDYTYKGNWGFSTLILTEATTGIHLYTVNRSGNILSQDKALVWIEKAIDAMKDYFETIIVRGDSAYYMVSLIKALDEKGIYFTISVDQFSNLQEMARKREAWKLLYRLKKRKRRHRKPNAKREAIGRRGFKMIRQQREYVSEFTYRPTGCKKGFRIVCVKQDKLEIQGSLFQGMNYHYYFYITNLREQDKCKVLELSRQRCNHENKVEQLKNGVSALKMPTKEFHANSAYMIIASMAWNMKSYLGLFTVDEVVRQEIIKMEYKRFRNNFINFPCQILKTSKKIVYRILGITPYTECLLKTFSYLDKVKVT